MERTKQGVEVQVDPRWRLKGSGSDVFNTRSLLSIFYFAALFLILSFSLKVLSFSTPSLLWLPLILQEFRFALDLKTSILTVLWLPPSSSLCLLPLLSILLSALFFSSADKCLQNWAQPRRMLWFLVLTCPYSESLLFFSLSGE